MSRDRDSDDENWEQKENSRTHSVKFTEDMPEVKEVSLCCCSNLFNNTKGWYKNKRKTNFNTRYTHRHLQYNVSSCLYHAGDTLRERWRDVGSWFRINVRENLSRHRAYLALSTILVVLE